jgi:hypothetical protein
MSFKNNYYHKYGGENRYGEDMNNKYGEDMNKYANADNRYADNKKKPDDTYDPLLVDTTTLVINVKTTGDLETKDYDLIPFHPNMVDVKDLTDNNYILFPSFVKVTVNDLQKAGTGVGSDYKKVFMNLDKYIKLIKYVTSPDKVIDNTLLVLDDGKFVSISSNKELTPAEIVTNNIGLIKQLFFQPQSRFYILGNEYVIGNSNYVPPFVEGQLKNLSKTSNKKIPTNYTITLQLQLLDSVNNPDAGDFSRMSCKTKKNSIAKDAMAIFGTNFGYKEPQRSIVIPSILHTAVVTKDRKYGKLQREWEDRNKYVRAPTTERERLEMERNMTSLQKKMAELDRETKETAKIPPEWINARMNLQDKYKAYRTEMLNLWTELNEVRKSNSDSGPVLNALLADVTVKMTRATQKILGTEQQSTDVEAAITKFIAAIAEKTTLEAATTLLKDKEEGGPADGFIQSAKTAEKEAIDENYVAPLLEGSIEIKKDIELLTADETAIKEKLAALLSSGDNYNVPAVKTELLTIQAKLRKKIAQEAMVAKKPEDIIADWERQLKKIDKLKQSVETEKTRSEKKNKTETLNKELKTMLEKIQQLTNDLLYAKYYEGDKTLDLTRSEKDKFKNKTSRPSESASDIEEDIKTLKLEFLETAEKFGIFDKIQAEITLINEDILREKKIMKEMESDLKDLNYKIQTLLRAENEIKRYLRTDTKNNLIIDSNSQKRLDKLKAEEEKYNTAIKKLEDPIDTDKKYIEKLEKYKKKLQDIKTISNAEQLYNDAKNKFNNKKKVSFSIGGSKKTRRRRYIKGKKSIKGKKKSIKRKKKSIKLRKNRTRRN